MTRKYNKIPSCTICGKRGVTHINSNNGEPRLKCRECETQFTFGVNRELIIVEVNQGVVCPECQVKCPRTMSNKTSYFYVCPICGLKLVKWKGEKEAEVYVKPEKKGRKVYVPTGESGWQKLNASSKRKSPTAIRDDFRSQVWERLQEIKSEMLDRKLEEMGL
jgi:hypothetical protein